jgi:hypothetical protein
MRSTPSPLFRTFQLSKTQVANKLFVVVTRSPTKIALCAQVTVIPEDNKIKVFHKGKPHGSNAEIPCGGQTQPIPMDGDNVQ